MKPPEYTSMRMMSLKLPQNEFLEIDHGGEPLGTIWGEGGRHVFQELVFVVSSDRRVFGVQHSILPKKFWLMADVRRSQ